MSFTNSSLAHTFQAASFRNSSAALSSSKTNITNSGDSYTTTGFNATTGPQPSPSNPLGNPPYPGYTSSNGPNWVDYITTTFNHSLLLTYNLAYGGATVDSSLVAQYLPTVLDLKQQVEDEFLPIYGNKANAQSLGADWNEGNSLFAIFIGINDVGNSYTEKNQSLNGDIFQVYHTLVEEVYIHVSSFYSSPHPSPYTSLLYLTPLIHPRIALFLPPSSLSLPFPPPPPPQSLPHSHPTNPPSPTQLYTSHARNFLFLNVPPVNRSPLTTSAGPSASALEASSITAFNAALRTLASTFSAAHADATVFLYDTNGLFTAVLDDPRHFPETAGYVNTTAYCVAYMKSVPIFLPLSPIQLPLLWL